MRNKGRRTGLFIGKQQPVKIHNHRESSEYADRIVSNAILMRMAQL